MKLCVALLLLALLTSGCFLVTSKWARLYTAAEEEGQLVSVTKNVTMDELDSQIRSYLASLGYRRELEPDSSDNFLVYIKDLSTAKRVVFGMINHPRILVRYTKISEDRTKIDIIPGTRVIGVTSEIYKDIKMLKAFMDSEPDL